MLRRGDKVTIGDKHARRYYYHEFVGVTGYIATGDKRMSLDIGKACYEVFIPRQCANGKLIKTKIVIHEEDCIPFKPKINSLAKLLLDKEY